MLFLQKKNKLQCHGVIYATQNGEIMPIEQIPDTVFAEKVLGDGVCILPSDGKVCAPISGMVDTVAESGHAYGIITEDGANIMVHIGVDTVELKGKGYKPKIKAGQKINIGDLLCTVDLKIIQQAGYAMHTAIILTNSDEFTATEKYYGTAVAGDTPAFHYQKSKTTAC